MTMNFEQSPLVEALLEVSFKYDHKPYDPTLAGLFYAKVGEDFTEKIEVPDFEYTFLQADGSSKKVNSPLTRFKNDGGHMIQFTKDLIIFNKTKPKVNWIELKTSVLKSLKHFVEVNKNQTITTFKLNYLNLIEVEKEICFSDIFNFKLPVPSNVKYDGVNGFDISTHFKLNDLFCSVNVETISSEKPEINRALFEISVLMSQDDEEFDSEKIEQWMDSAHASICEIFADHLTPQQLEKYK